MDRKYQMTRIKSGDYLLPSNDAQWLWRIAQYDEDGGAEYADGRKLVGRFWACYRMRMPGDRTPMEDVLEWESAWEFWSGPHTTRSAAIKDALSVEEIAAQRER